MKPIIDTLVDLLNYINPFSDKFILKTIINTLGNLLNYINPFSEDFIGKKIIDLLGTLLKNLFVPKENYFSDLIEEFKTLLAEKIPYEAYIQLFENIQDVSEGNPAGLDVNFSGYKIGDKTISTGSNWIKFDLLLKFKETWFQWCRGFTYIFFIIYNIHQFIKLINKGNGVANGGKSGESEHIYDNGSHKWVR